MPDATPGFIESIKEDPTCQYVLVFSTSLLCGHAAFSPSAPAVHHIRCLADGPTAGELVQSQSAEAAVLEGAQPGGVGVAGGEGTAGGAATGAAQAAAATAEGKPRCCRQAFMLRLPGSAPRLFGLCSSFVPACSIREFFTEDLDANFRMPDTKWLEKSGVAYASDEADDEDDDEEFIISTTTEEAAAGEER